MGRIVKSGPVRRAEILTHAVNLFFRKGYDATTIEDILASVSLSKGAFYHHFKSKEELLEAFTAVIAGSIAEQGSRLLAEDCSECERLNRVLKIGQRIQYESDPAPISAYASLFRTENAPLYRRIMDVGSKTLKPMLLAIISAGIAKGEFDVPDASLAAETILQLSVTRFQVIVDALRLAQEGDMRNARRLLDLRIDAECRLVERILGLAANSVALADPGHVESALLALSAGSARHRAAKRLGKV